MEGKQRTGERRLKHCCQCNRFEDELWAAAYEQIWPLRERALVAERPRSGRVGEKDIANRMARRA
jgi:hypothetical protein